MTSERTTAVGGVREVPVPDAIARDYLLLALRLDQHVPGTVDGYFGPASLKAQADMEQLRSPARLAEDARWTVPPERLTAVVDVLVPRYRAWAAAHYPMPPDEDLRVSLVHDQPWSGYNWYDGGYRSRVDFNLDLPVRLPSFVGTVAHETYPGHHLEHARKEQVLVEELGHLEASVLVINTPECLISEGLANLGRELVVPPADRPALLAELASVAGLALADDTLGLQDAASRQSLVAGHRQVLDESRLNAALMLHADGVPRDQVLAYLIDVGRFDPATAAKRLEFIEHPLWRLYIHVYFEGEQLLRRWLHLVPEADRPARFGRLLAEPHTPRSIQAEIDAAD